jgi:hypothetical protein
MRLDNRLLSFVCWMGLALSAGTAALTGCDTRKEADDDDDSRGASGGIGSACDSEHPCKSGLSCEGGVCIGTSGTGGSGGGSGGTPPMGTGELGSVCDGSQPCNSGLRCYSGFCIPEDMGSGGTGATEGTLAGPCYPNETCNAGLVCTSGYCLPDSGSGGSGAGGGGGSPGTGGVSAGGGPQGGVGGSDASGGAGGSTGGTGGSSGGAGGAGGSSGTGGSGGTPTTLIVTNDGWVAEGSNSAGVVGPWYVFFDTYSTILPLPGGSDFVGAGPAVCVQGTTSQSDVYGPTVALNLNQPDGEGEPLGYVPLDHGVTGFSFGISGSLPPSYLQVTFAGLDDAQFCRTFVASSTNTVRLSDTSLDCWNPTGAQGSTSTSFKTLQFQLPVNYHADGQSFDFCLTNLTALTN